MGVHSPRIKYITHPVFNVVYLIVRVDVRSYFCETFVELLKHFLKFQDEQLKSANVLKNVRSGKYE